MIAISFLGGTREATGSQFLLETDRAKILIDCGLHQGCHFCEGNNLAPFSYDPAAIDAVVVTHAHLDHSGLLPKLVREGFRGRIFATAPTRDFSEILLEDSAGLIEEEMRGRGKEPPYGPPDVAPTIARFTPLSYREPQEIAPGVSIELFDAGHVLGSASVVAEVGGKRIVFSGDLGNSPMPLLKDREPPDRADYVLIESTYGDRIHEDRNERRAKLHEMIGTTIKQKGTLLIPAFAFERTQELLAEMNTLVESGRIPRIPVFVDSPLAIKATAIYQRYSSYYNPREQQAIREGDLPFQFPGLRFTKTVEESKEINDVPPPKIIIAGSGMMQGGRVLHHARRYLSDPHSTLLIVGYQAAGSLGRRLLTHARRARIFSETVAVRARVRAIGGYSAHADQEGLLDWLSAIPSRPKKVFPVQGEPAAALALRNEIRDGLGIEAEVPFRGERLALE